METTFFSSLASLLVEGDWVITVKAAPNNRMLVSVLFKNDKVGDNARKLITPMILKGTAQEIDNGFFTTIETPVKQTNTLFVNMEAYHKSQEAAKTQSRMQKDKEQELKKGKDANKTKYEAAMKKVDELADAGKYREAYGQLPKTADFPEYEQDITTRREELSAQFEQPSLF